MCRYICRCRCRFVVVGVLLELEVGTIRSLAKYAEPGGEGLDVCFELTVGNRVGSEETGGCER